MNNKNIEIAKSYIELIDCFSFSPTTDLYRTPEKLSTVLKLARVDKMLGFIEDTLVETNDRALCLEYAPIMLSLYDFIDSSWFTLNKKDLIDKLDLLSLTEKNEMMSSVLKRHLTYENAFELERVFESLLAAHEIIFHS